VDLAAFVNINRVLSAAWGVAPVVMGAASVLVTALDAQAGGTRSPRRTDQGHRYAVTAHPTSQHTTSDELRRTYSSRSNSQSLLDCTVSPIPHIRSSDGVGPQGIEP
jgi:hypothetical protein